MRWADVATAARAAERWLLPAECLTCREASAGDALVCDACRRRWPPVAPPWCTRCGQPGLPEVACRLCAQWPDAMGRVRSAVWLDGGARHAAHALKYDGWWRVAEAMALAMRPLEPLTGAVTLVPVPLGARRLRQRGYNQAARLAEALGRVTGRPVAANCLSRRRETASQTTVGADERMGNVAGAFSARDVPGAAVVLVDDVFTTGATLLACAEALLAAGAPRVEAVTFARAPLPLLSAARRLTYHTSSWR